MSWPCGFGVERKTVAVDGYRVSYYQTGAGVPIVFLHGGASDARDWVPVINSFVEGYACYAPDLIGYGLTDSIKDAYFISDYYGFIRGFTDSLGLDGVVLVGHSLGGRAVPSLSPAFYLKTGRIVRGHVLKLCPG